MNDTPEHVCQQMTFDGDKAKLFPAFIKAQQEMGEVLKSSVNPAFRSKYADLGAVIEAVLPALHANGFALLQPPHSDGSTVEVETILIHTSGGFIRSSIAMKPTKADPQGIGSAVTYARRYALQSICGVAPEDDDGNAASARPAANQSTPPARVTPAPEGPDWWGCTDFGMTAHAAKKEGLGERHGEMLGEIDALASGDEWRAWCRANFEAIARMPQSWRVILRERAEAMAVELGVDLNAKRAA